MGLMAWELRRQEQENLKDITAINEAITVAVSDTPDVGGGGTEASVGFALKDVAGHALHLQAVLEFAVFDDSGLSIPASVAFLNTPTKGTIIAGEGTAALKVKTDANGEFACKLINLSPSTVWVATSPSFGGYVYNCSSKDSITFSV